MPATADLKAGQTAEFPLGDKTLVVEPIPFGRLKKIIRIIAEVSGKVDKKKLSEDFLSVVPPLLDGYIDEFIPLLFSSSKHPFVTKEWIEDNLTIPVTRQIIVAAIQVNGLGDFFGKTARPLASKAVSEENGTSSIRSESIGSITSSDSPMDGAPKTSTS